MRFANRPRREHRANACERGYDARWNRLRKAHIQANPLCFNCTAIAVIVDHIVPITIAPERRLDRTNLRSVCRSCHARITARFEREGVNELPNGHTKKLATGGWAEEH